MEKCDEWLRSEAVKKFKFLTAREELIALEFAAWLNQQSAQQSVQPTVEACPEDRHDYYTALLSYLFCPYCGERLHSG